MPAKFDPEIHYRRSIRLKGYDYSQAGAYFVTIVTAGRQCLFGRVENQEMILGDLGHIAEQQWMRLSSRFPNVEVGAFIVMPNHVHGILMIYARRGTAGNLADSDDASYCGAPTEGFGMPVPGSIPTVIRSYKSAVAYRVHAAGKMTGLPVWQRNYYEHVIRDDREMDQIWRHIESNPCTWATDKENPARIAPALAQ